MQQSRCPVCFEVKPVPPKTRVTCQHLGTPDEKMYVADIVTSIPYREVEDVEAQPLLFEVEKTRTHTRDDF